MCEARLVLLKLRAATPRAIRASDKFSAKLFIVKTPTDDGLCASGAGAGQAHQDSKTQHIDNLAAHCTGASSADQLAS